MITEHFSILRQDVRHAWRSLRRTPVITITATLTLALGVGATTAVFSVVHAVLIRPLPYPEADRLVELFESNSSASMRASALNYLSWAERSKSFDAIAAFGNAGLTLTGDGDPDLLNGSVVTPSLFDVLAVSPIVGRTLRPDDEQRGSSRVVVDPMTFAAVGGAVMLVACAASAFPAVRAAHIDPTIAMRTE